MAAWRGAWAAAATEEKWRRHQYIDSQEKWRGISMAAWRRRGDTGGGLPKTGSLIPPVKKA